MNVKYAGLSYHVSHALVNISGEYVQHSFVHLLETTKQVRVSRISFQVYSYLIGWPVCHPDRRACPRTVEEDGREGSERALR